MSPAEILAVAIRRAKSVVPIQQITAIPVPLIEPERPQFIPPPPLKTIIETVANHYGISVMNLLSHRTSREFVYPRWIAICVAWQLTPHSYSIIGRAMGDRDHTTIGNAARKMEVLFRTNKMVRHDVEQIKLKLAPTV